MKTIEYIMNNSNIYFLLLRILQFFITFEVNRRGDIKKIIKVSSNNDDSSSLRWLLFVQRISERWQFLDESDRDLSGYVSRVFALEHHRDLEKDLQNFQEIPEEK